MKRRNFLKLGSVGTIGLATEKWLDLDLLPSLGDANELASSDGLSINPIVPVRIFENRKDEMLKQLVTIKEKYGLKRFLLCAPMDEVMLAGFPGRDVYQRIGENIRAVKSEIEPHGIEIGWWCAPSLRSGYDKRYQQIVDLSGRTADYSPCPLDPVFAEEFSNNIALVVEIAKPFAVQFEDDYELSWHPPNNVNFGCFCSRHLAEFAEKTGRTYTREMLYDLFQQSNAETIALRRKWADMSRETLVGLAKRIRNKVDKVAPDTRISLCQSGVADFDGDFTEAVTRAFAGNTRPLTRLYGTSYGSDEALSMPSSIFHALYSRQHLPDDIECIHESDTNPHTRFFMSATKIRSFMTTAFAYGFDDSLFYSTQYLDNLLEEKGYLEMYRRESKRFSSLKDAVNGAPVVGCEIVHHPFAHTAVPYRPNNNGWGGRPNSPQNPWANVLSRFGIPYTAKNGTVKAISGDSLKIMSDSEIESLLRAGVLLDGYAAFVLTERGFGKWIGAEVSSGTEASFWFEGVRDLTRHRNLQSKLMYNFGFGQGSIASDTFYLIKPHSQAEIITDFLDAKETPVIPGFIRFENELGGRVAITSFALSRNSSSAVFNYKKKELLRETIEWLGRENLPVYVNDQPNVFCVCNEHKEKDYLIVTVITTSADKISSLSFDVAPKWRQGRLTYLSQEGWKPVGFNRIATGFTTKVDMSIMEPAVFKISL